MDDVLMLRSDPERSEGSRLEARTMAIQRLLNFFTASYAGMTGEELAISRAQRHASMAARRGKRGVPHDACLSESVYKLGLPAYARAGALRLAVDFALNGESARPTVKPAD